MYEGMAVGSGPYTVKAYDPTAIRVSNIANGMVGKPVEFESKWFSMYILENHHNFKIPVGMYLQRNTVSIHFHVMSYEMFRKV